MGIPAIHTDVNSSEQPSATLQPQHKTQAKESLRVNSLTCRARAIKHSMAALQPECTTADKREEYSAMKLLLPPHNIDVHLRSKMEEKVKSTTAITQIAMDQWNMILCLCLRTMICGYSSIIHMWTYQFS